MIANASTRHARASSPQPASALRVRVGSHSIGDPRADPTLSPTKRFHMTELATNTPKAIAAPTDDAAPWWRTGPVGRTLDLFSSVKLGIWLMALLFVYSSIGSAGILYPEHPNIFKAENWAHDQIRQWRGLEMTEFEWFHWWPFDLMMILLTINIVVTTLRRIPFKAVNYGVWMIHTGIVVLIVGSFIYFGTKVEGDTPVARRKVVAQYSTTADDGTPRTETVEFLAAPGVKFSRGTGANEVKFEVTSVDPAWELLTGDSKGERTYSVTVAVDRDGKRYMRQLLAGHPDLTEDLIFTSDTQQPMKRAVKEIGKPIFDESMSMALDYEPQQWLYLRNELVKSWALYVRKPGEKEWIERPIHGMPMYNDYVAEPSMVFQMAGDIELPKQGLDIKVPAVDAADPFPDVVFDVSGYLRYAIPRRRFVEGPAGSPLNPVAFVTIQSDSGQRGDYRLVAFDRERSRADGGLLRLASIASEAEFAPLTQQPAIEITIPSQGVTVREEIREVAATNPDAPFVEIKVPDGAAGPDGKPSYAYRIVNVSDDLPVAGRTVSVAILELRTPKGVFRRWVFSDPTLTRDVVAPDASDAHGAPKLEDDSVIVTYAPGNGLSLVSIVHGPETGRMRLITSIGRETKVVDIGEKQPVKLDGGITVVVEDLMERAVFESKPLVIPKEQRERDAMEIFSQIRLAAPNGKPEWLPFNRWVFDSPERVLRRSPYEPRTVRLADGREVELLFSRQRLPLETKISLEEFVLTAHVGGFTGRQGTIRDYTSRVRFKDEGDATWTEPVSVSVNDPIEHDGYWYFQAQWDPPDETPAEGQRASAGLNYTVLGVGNRNGVYTQLLGCCIAVLGMIYAFYVKPVIKRRRQEEVLAGLARGRGAEGAQR